jgi:hypothetical protein
MTMAEEVVGEREREELCRVRGGIWGRGEEETGVICYCIILNIVLLCNRIQRWTYVK